MFDALAAGGLGDRSRIYVVGGSNGGMMAHRLACEMAGRIAAMTVMVASMPVPLAPRCRPGRPMPMLMMNGTEDPLMPFAGGVVARAEENGRVVPAMDTVAFWRTHNACPEDATRSEVPDRDPADGMRTDVLSWSPCRDGTEVVFHRMNGAGHGLPGRSRTKSELAERLGGRSTNDFDSSEEAWAFVSRFVRTPGT
jgi:polyhydroxybutyrate depolymerase